MILTGEDIRRLGIVSPHVDRTVNLQGLSYGEGAAGYDVRVEFDSDGERSHHTLQPTDFLLVSTIEHFSMPLNVVGVVHDKSTWARRGLTVQNTVIEPGWAGYLTLEIANHSPTRVLLERSDPIAQIVFHMTRTDCAPYNGKYQFQGRGPQRAR